jgi:hypothetical protein
MIDMMKKIIIGCAGFIIANVSIAAASTSSVQAGTAKSKLITDIHGYWAEQTLDRWLDAGWLHGYDDKTVRPNQPISRGEFISLINRSFGFTERASIDFHDLKPEEWEYAEVQKAVKEGYLTGYPDQTVHVHDTVSRQEAAVMIARLLKLKAADQAKSAGYTDEVKAAAWSKEAIKQVTAKGIMEGYDDHTFKPSRAISRAEAVVVLNQAVSEKSK